MAAVSDRYTSLEVFSDDIPAMVTKARFISNGGRNFYGRLRIIDTHSEKLGSQIVAAGLPMDIPRKKWTLQNKLFKPYVVLSSILVYIYV